VCIGNSCRSQMAEGFARTYGSDVMVAASAGLAPAGIVASLTHQTMAEWNIKLEAQFPKGLDVFPSGARFDIVVNISGHPLPAAFGAAVEEWKVRDPIGEKPEVYGQVAGELETLVMTLILRLRAGQPKPPVAAAKERDRVRQGLGRALGRSGI
ncbi:MAG: hypothetical protein ABI165_10635, partial [Bryobacteraceae bacterium]